MDFARKIGKPEKPRIWKKTRQPFVTTKDNLLCGDISFSEDRRFINWKKWLADRKKQTRHVESVTGRSQADQLQNSSERFRSFVEMRNLMEYAAIPVITDKYREGPGFWKTPEFLPDRGDACLPKIFLTPSKRDLNLRPDLMHVGLPDLIAKERDLAARETKEEFWKRSEYLKTRKHELTEEIALLLPKEPETATLAIRGCAYKKKKLPILRIPPITITEPDEDEPCEDADQTAVLKIQDREFVWRRSLLGRTEPVDAEPIVWSLTFVGRMNERVEKEIVVENKGTHVIIFHWRYSPFRTYGVSLERRGSPFFFNKTKGLVLPGQIVRIKVWYRSRIHGVFTEFWRFVTEPKLNSSTFIFRFWGCATDIQSRDLTDCRMIDEYLNRRIRDSTILSIIEEILVGVEQSETRPSEAPYEVSLSQSDLFVSLNPYYYYHPSIVMKLNAIYSDVTDKSMPAWNLSLDTLRDILLQIENTNYKHDMLARFNELCKQSLRPKLIKFDVAYYNKYDAAYNILCAFANLFEDESKLTKRHSLIREEPAKPMGIEKLSQRFNNNSQEIHNKQLNDQSGTALVQEEKENFNLNSQLYREIFFIRIYKALEEVIERVCSSIDSFHKLNKLKLKI